MDLDRTRTSFRLQIGLCRRLGSPLYVELLEQALADEAAARELECLVWADQPARLEPLRGAIEMARADPPRIDRARAETGEDRVHTELRLRSWPGGDERLVAELHPHGAFVDGYGTDA